MPQSRNQYEVIESFVDQVGAGKEYAKVRYKGIEQVGYISRVAGPGKSISEDWYKEKKRQQPDELVRRVVGMVKGNYRTSEFGLTSRDFDFKITIEGKTTLGEDTAEDFMRDSLQDSLDFSETQIEALSKATIEVGPNDQEAIDIDLQEGQTEPFSGKFEMVFVSSDSWFGYGIPEDNINFPNTTIAQRKLTKADRTI